MAQDAVALWPKKPTRSGDIDYPGMRDEVLTSGLWARWSRVAQCPCQQHHTLAGVTPTDAAFLGDPRADCGKCNGRGLYVYHSQIIPVAVTSTTHIDQVPSIPGAFSNASVRFTLLQEHIAQLYDRLEVIGTKNRADVDFDPLNRLVIAYSERKKHKTTVESLRFPIVQTEFRLGNPSDSTTLDLTTYGVDNCIAATVDGAIIDVPLIEGTDFTVTTDGQIDWTLGEGRGTAPAVGARYSIRYLAHPSYIIKSFPFATRAQTRSFKGESQLARLNYCVDAWAEWLGEDNQP